MGGEIVVPSPRSNPGCATDYCRLCVQVRKTLGTTLVVGRRTNTPCCDRPLYLPDDVTRLARQTGRLFQAGAEDYFFIPSNVFPWERISDVVIGRPAYDIYLVEMAVRLNVSVVDATNTLLAFHQTDKEGNFAGRKNVYAHFNYDSIGKFAYRYGSTTDSQFYTVSCTGRNSTEQTVAVHRRLANELVS